MDFSDPATALKSLQRRTFVSEPVRSTARTLAQGPFQGDEALTAQLHAAEEAVSSLITSECWEGTAVGFLLAKHMVEVAPTDLSQDFKESLLQFSDQHLEHSEPRVRGLVAQLLGAMARAGDQEAAGGGLRVYQRFQARLAESIQGNFERTSGTFKAKQDDRDVAVDDTSGWKALETSLLALKEFVDAIGRPIMEEIHLGDELVGYIVKGATVHINRHVREASFKIIRSIIEACGALEGDGAPPGAGRLAEVFAEALAVGLQDNWSQVRYAASVANRALLTALPPQARDRYYPRLLPRMCLNRYYLAEGVKLYSQESWQLFMGKHGPQKVAELVADVVPYYVWASKADNHCVREAACHSIAEMASKVDHQAQAPFVGELLEALLVCFHDESWPVRDAACVASGRFALSYPEECRPALDNLYERWFKHLADPIWSVREDSAVALGEVCRAYGEPAVQRVSAWVRDNLPKAKEQPAQSAEEWRKQQNDAKAHTGNQVYSCGSLAPKLKKGGCSDCEVTRASLPWEHSDGAVYMLRELSAVDVPATTQFFPELACVAALTHFPQADNIRETTWKQLPVIANRLGKKEFKRHLEVFLVPLFDTLRRPSSNQLALHAAGGCIRELSAFVGPSIFRGRLEPDMQHLMDTSPYVAAPLPGPPVPVTAGVMMTGPGYGMSPGNVPMPDMGVAPWARG